MDRIIEVFTRERLTAGHGGANPSDTPVFIVGMARSGSSLLEQILASHPQIYGAGELEFFPRLKLNTDSNQTVSYIDLIDRLTNQTMTSISEGYLQSLGEKDTKHALRIVDKMPDNYLHLGLIAMMFPNATILHSCRDALDVLPIHLLHQLQLRQPLRLRFIRARPLLPSIHASNEALA